jgi:hypothetical protein
LQIHERINSLDEKLERLLQHAQHAETKSRRTRYVLSLVPKRKQHKNAAVFVKALSHFLFVWKEDVTKLTERTVLICGTSRRSPSPSSWNRSSRTRHNASRGREPEKQDSEEEVDEIDLFGEFVAKAEAQVSYRSFPKKFDISPRLMRYMQAVSGEWTKCMSRAHWWSKNAGQPSSTQWFDTSTQCFDTSFVQAERNVTKGIQRLMGKRRL